MTSVKPPSRLAVDYSATVDGANAINENSELLLELKSKKELVHPYGILTPQTLLHLADRKLVLLGPNCESEGQ